MLLGQLMTEAGPVDPQWTGRVENDDNVLAVNVSGSTDAHPDTYAVVQGSILGVDAQLNATTQDRTYIREGTSTTKSSTQRTFAVTGDRQVGPEFQDFALSLDVIYGVGEKVITDYVWFNMYTGKGERGQVAIIVNSDGSGNAGEPAGISIDLRKVGAMPVAYNYTPEGALSILTVTSVAGTEAGATSVSAAPALPSGMTAMYQTSATVALPEYDAVVDAGWTAFTPGVDIAAVTGNEIAVVYRDADNKAKYAGKTTVTVAE